MSDDASEMSDDSGETSDESSEVNETELSGKRCSWKRPEYWDKRKKARNLVQQWLTTGSGILHVSGKPGAGKSTLMKLIYNHPRTKTLLKEWAGGKTLISVPFFFWNSGSKLQMSLPGLYRSLLYHVLAQFPALIPDILPAQWRMVSHESRLEPSLLDSEMFRPDDIEQAFVRLIETPLLSDKFRICFFIDGLDEYEAHVYDHKKLAVQLCQWSKNDNVKICVSSRPHVEFLYTFPSENRINLHQVTALDIWRLGCDMFEKDENFERVDQIYEDLVDDIVKRAQGVILWARLALKSVIYEVSLHSSPARLKQKISSLPREMDELYDTILQSLDASDRRRVDLILYLVQFYTEHKLDFWSTFVAWLDDITESSLPSSAHLPSIRSIREYTQFIESTKRQLLGLTKGLLVTHRVTHHYQEEIIGYKVNFFHRTVGDYLRLPWRQKRFDKAFPNTDFCGITLRLQMYFLVTAFKVGQFWAGLFFITRFDHILYPPFSTFKLGGLAPFEVSYSFLGSYIPPRFRIPDSKLEHFRVLVKTSRKPLWPTTRSFTA